MNKPVQVIVRIGIVAFLVLILTVIFSLYGPSPSEVYSGGLQNGVPHGYGTWKHSNGNYYSGNFYEGLRHGRGTWIHPEGIKYAGEWQQGEYHGRGTLLLPRGARYDGHWFEGQKNGPGIYRWPEGRIYIGYWVNDRFDGLGLYMNGDGFIYEGKWFDGRKHGEGSAVYPDGSKYIGQWLNDRRHGHGIMVYSDGSIYEGSWSEDVRDDEGSAAEDYNNVVSPITPDTVLVTAKTADDSQIAASKNTVNTALVPVTGVRLDRNAITIYVGETATLIAMVLPTNATNSDVFWATSNSALADVYQQDGLRGEVKAHKPGEVLITVTTVENYRNARCLVTILEKVDPADKVIVPRLAGKQLDVAQKMITDAELALGEISFQFHESIPIDQVISQKPAVGDSVNKGSIVNLIISKGPEYEIQIESEPDS